MAILRIPGQEVRNAHILASGGIVDVGLQLPFSLPEGLQQRLPGQTGNGGLGGIAALQRRPEGPLQHGIKGAGHLQAQQPCKIAAVPVYDLRFHAAHGHIELIGIQRVLRQRLHQPRLPRIVPHGIHPRSFHPLIFVPLLYTKMHLHSSATLREFGKYAFCLRTDRAIDKRAIQTPPPKPSQAFFLPSGGVRTTVEAFLF